MEPLEPKEAESLAASEVEAAAGVARRIEENIRRAVSVCAGRARPRARHAARRGPHPRRGLPGRRQDGAGARAQPLDRLPVRARPVHGRPAAGRHRRRQRLQPARGALRVPPRADLRQRRARRRDQPRLAEDAVGPARVHAGAPRHRRRRLARAGAAVHGLRDAEPGRVRGHLPAARGAGRPLHGPAVARLSRPAGRGRDARRPRGRRPRARARAGRRPRRGRRGAGRRRGACTPRARCATTSSRCCATRAPTTASSSAPRRAPACCCCAPPRPTR